MSNLLTTQSLDQKINNLSHDVPHSTPEVEWNNGSINNSSSDNSHDHLESSVLNHNVIASKLQILDGENLWNVHLMSPATCIVFSNKGTTNGSFISFIKIWCFKMLYKVGSNIWECSSKNLPTILFQMFRHRSKKNYSYVNCGSVVWDSTLWIQSLISKAKRLKGQH